MMTLDDDCNGCIGDNLGKVDDFADACLQAHSQRFLHQSPPRRGGFVFVFVFGLTSPTLLYSSGCQATLARLLLPVEGFVFLLAASDFLEELVKEENSLIWVENPLTRFISKPCKI